MAALFNGALGPVRLRTPVTADTLEPPEGIIMRGAELDRIEPQRGKSPRGAHEARAGDEARWREFVEQAPGVLLSLARAGTILDLSAPLAGRAPEFWRGRRLPEALGADDGRPIARALALLERGAPPQEVLVSLDARGERRLYRFRLARVEGVAASVGAPAFSGFAADVTREVAEERALSEREALLARRHKSAMLAYLAGGVAHDLNNLLTVIVGAADLLHEDPVHDDDERRAELTQIQRAGRRASEITRQLLAFSRREPSLPLVLNLETCVRELAPLLARLLGPNIRLDLEFPAKLWLVRLDPLHAEHVLTHLVLHARQAMPHGGVLSLSLANVHVESFERRGGIMVGPGEYVELGLRDTGSGMSTTAIERAFEPFFAAEQMPGSTDLTLPLVRNLVVHAFGHLWLTSEAGHGTVFHVLFPRYDEHRPSAPPRHRPDLGTATPAPRSKARRRRGPRRRSRH
jgi:signal transduction histidine kinase